MNWNQPGKPERTWPICGAEKVFLAKKIAVLLAENAATISDMLDIFKMVELELTGHASIPESSFSYGISPLEFPDKMRDDDRIWDK